MRLNPQDWLRAPPTQRLLAAFEGTALRFVGGCVRDALLGRPVRDIDCATTALPEETMALLERAGLKAVPTGLEHGTITAVVDGKPFEITTLRRDVSCDGRRAVVAFSDDWQEDAARRDFTMNALYCDADGQLFDYHHGIDDAKAGRVRFIGDPAQRIEEDALRILRFFRFYAAHGQGEPDASAMAACTQQRHQLEHLSGERIQHELLKLLAAAQPRAALEAMYASGVLNVVVPQGQWPSPESTHPNPILRLALMLPDAPAASALASRLKLSNHHRDLLLFLVENPYEAFPQDDREMIHIARHLSAEHYRLLLLRNAAKHGTDDVSCAAMLERFSAISMPHFPVRGSDLLARGIPAGSLIGETLKRLEAEWEQSGYQLSKNALLDLL